MTMKKVGQVYSRLSSSSSFDGIKAKHAMAQVSKTKDSLCTFCETLTKLNYLMTHPNRRVNHHRNFVSLISPLTTERGGCVYRHRPTTQGMFVGQWVHRTLRTPDDCYINMQKQDDRSGFYALNCFLSSIQTNKHTRRKPFQFVSPTSAALSAIVHRLCWLCSWGDHLKLELRTLNLLFRNGLIHNMKQFGRDERGLRGKWSWSTESI